MISYIQIYYRGQLEYCDIKVLMITFAHEAFVEYLIILLIKKNYQCSNKID